MTVTVHDASLACLNRLCEIEMECFREEAFTRKQMVQLLTDYNSVSLVAIENDRILGFIIAVVYVGRSGLSGRILTIDVWPTHRQRGVGQMLLQEIEKIFEIRGVKTSHLEVREDNVAAISLYLKMGYRRIGKLKNYYGNAHGIYLKKTLG